LSLNTATIDDVANWVIVDILKRDDVQTTARNAALYFYKVLCANIAFDELMALSAEIPTVVGQDVYDLNSLVPALKAIFSIRMTFDSSNRRRLRRSHTRVYDALSFIQNGRPATYARFGTTIQFEKPPDSAAYTFRTRYWSVPAISNPIQNTVLTGIPDEWTELVRWETLYRVFNAIGETQKAALLVQPTMIPRQPSPKRQKMFEVGILPRLWNELLSTVSQKEGSDEDFGINPLIRAYSYRGR
jgi:hypothetical protein